MTHRGGSVAYLDVGDAPLPRADAPQPIVVMAATTVQVDVIRTEAGFDDAFGF